MDTKTRERIKMLYFSGYQVIDIAKILNLDVPTVRGPIFGFNDKGNEVRCFHMQKKSMNSASIAAYVAEKVNVLNLAGGLAMNVVIASLSRLNNSMQTNPDLQLEPDDLRKISAIATDMDKLVRLENGQSTEIVEMSGLSPEEAAEAIKKLDPFFSAIPVESTEVTDD